MLGLLLNTLPAQPGHVAHITKRREPTREPIANVERSAVRGKHRGFSWDALSVTNATTCGGGPGELPGGPACSQAAAKKWKFCDVTAPLDERVTDLVERITLEEAGPLLTARESPEVPA